ncbi:nucleoside phosphorylase domain-containing protein [Nemania sp. NC0429]|nr:nucleoside phosphorylase domain-containing protein [Nemania sp. NC0429]
MAQSNPKRLDRRDYHVVWICPGVALDPARVMLDEEHNRPIYNADYDENSYICGTMEGHNVVLATNPPGMSGNVIAGRFAGPIFNTFPNIKMTMLIGIGGGVPSPTPADDTLKDIHLGDVMVGWPGDGKQAVVYYESGRLLHDGYKHKGDKESCAGCNDFEMVVRNPRTRKHQNQFIFHRGQIGTGNAIVVDANHRDSISKRCGGLQCIEMSAAGVDANKNCLVIRGISDYYNTHKNEI